MEYNINWDKYFSKGIYKNFEGKPRYLAPQFLEFNFLLDFPKIIADKQLKQKWRAHLEDIEQKYNLCLNFLDALQQAIVSKEIQEFIIKNNVEYGGDYVKLKQY